MKRLTIFLAGALLLGLAVAGQGRDADEVVLLWNGLKIPAQHSALLVAPGSEQELRFAGRGAALNLEVQSCEPEEGSCRKKTAAVVLRAPSIPGNYWLTVRIASGKPGSLKSEDYTIALLVGFPSSLLVDGFLYGFELGEYPDPSEMKNPQHYKPPAYFFRLDYNVLGCWLSERIRLGDLGYDGRAPVPQYFALDYNLVKKLEVLADELEDRGLPSRFHYIGGGFISPKSNQVRTSENSAAAKLSRHQWGEAVDFIIDERPRDGIMDDMNRDGRIDVRDAFVVRDILTQLENSGRCTAGGIGVYSPPRNSQIQLHVDVRGFATRWGYKDFNEEMAEQPPQKSLRPGG